MSEIIRRDPRGDCGAVSEWLGPNGVVRKNPRAIGFIGPNGVKRIDRSGLQQGGQATATTTAARDSRRTVTIDQPAFLVAVVPDLTGGRLSGHDKDLLGLARRVADADAEQPGAVVAILFGEHKGEGGGELKEQALGEAGIDRVVHLDDEFYAGFAPEARLAALSAVEREMMPDSPLGGADLGRRLALRLGERAATGVWQVEADNEAPLGWRCTARGAAGSLDIQRPLPRVALALAECAEPVDETRHAAEHLALAASIPTTLSRIEDLGQVAVDPAGVALAEAEFILSGGNGVKQWDAFHHAAKVLGATEGASRVAVDDGFMARDRQVGATGTWVTARVYMAVGISGAIQHLQGIQRCDKVVAINLDPGCDIIKRADLAVIGDSTQILAALVAMVEQQRGGQRDAA